MPEQVQIDLIIISYAEDSELKRLTENCLVSLVESEILERVKFNIVVIESNKYTEPYTYPNTQTIYPSETFGYHKFLNIGINITTAPYICICNNDLTFHCGWASEILAAFEQNPDLSSASPLCKRHHQKHQIDPNSGHYFGFDIGKELTGWCILFKREILKITGLLDDKFKFWYADNDYANTLQMHSLKHALVSSSLVDHLESKTLNSRNNFEKKVLTMGEKIYYQYKWENKPASSYWYEITKFYLQVNFLRFLSVVKGSKR